MKLLLCPNGYTEAQADQARHCVSFLEERCGCACALSPDDSLRLYGDGRYARFEPSECDLIVSLGGDGSVLRAAQTSIAANRPLLGINSGRLGYLCALELDELDRFNDVASSGCCAERALLEAVSGGETYFAVNDVIAGKRSFGETVDLSVWIDGEEVMQVRGDGLIVATPVGSTAYNASSGGPVLDQDAPVFALTPVCCHTSGAVPVVLSDRREILIAKRSGRAELYADGRDIGALGEGISLRKSERTLRLFSRRSTVGGMASARIDR